MKIELNSIPIRDLVKKYADDGEEGVVGYGGKLDIRPPYQREFVYDGKQRDAVIDTVMKGYPLNVMYWVENDDGTYEVLDGQQRTVSICQYAVGDFSLRYRGFGNLTSDEQNNFLEYKLQVYFCQGTDKEKMDWFETVNIAGIELKKQELRNSVYRGVWLADAKRYFSRSGCPAYEHGKGHVSGSPLRQDLLETAIDWIAQKEIESSVDKPIDEYMSKHQNDENASKLWQHYRAVLDWAKITFPCLGEDKPYPEMRTVPWGALYLAHGQEDLNAQDLDAKVKTLLDDDDITKKSGIWQYVLNGEEKWLSIRRFTDAQKRKCLKKQEGKCNACGVVLAFDDAQADHILPWSKGGKTEPSNCQVLCRSCNASKGAK